MKKNENQDRYTKYNKTKSPVLLINKWQYKNNKTKSYEKARVLRNSIHLPPPQSRKIKRTAEIEDKRCNKHDNNDHGDCISETQMDAVDEDKIIVFSG